jgi:hypothetical protein
MIQAETFNGITYYSAEARGVSYSARIDPLGRWEVFSRRLALSAARMGGTVRHFSSLTEMANAIRAYRGLDLLLEVA